MADRLRWWVIPGALVVMARVVTLDHAPAATEVPTHVVPATAPAKASKVLEASGRRVRADALPAFGEQALVVRVPTELAGQRVEMTVWRRGTEGREAKAWLVFAPRVRDDATIPIAGLAAGRYDLVLRCDGEAPGNAGRVFAADGITAPGQIVFGEATPGR